MKQVLQKGLKVAVFEDPITGRKLEGMAKLYREFTPDCGDGLSVWQVCFEGDCGAAYLRTINLANCFTDIGEVS
jgi:hypothetical protein